MALAFRLRTQIALCERLQMFGPKSGLRKIAAILALSTTITLSGTISANAADDNSKTLEFLSSKFVNKQYLEGFSAGKADYGFTLEAMLQRKALGLPLTKQIDAVNHVLNNATIAGKAGVGYLFDDKKVVKPGLAGKFLFTSAALSVANNPIRNTTVAALKKIIQKDGTIIGSTGNTFDYAWVVLGLEVNGQKTAANLVANKLAAMAKTDGGFGYDLTADTTKSSTDSTGIALQALSSVKAEGTAGQIATRKNVVAAAKKWLSSTIAVDHWESWGDYDVNGTAYAAMGLKASGSGISKISAWLKTKLAPTGGLVTPWSNGSGDAFATAQAVAPLIGLSYLDLLPKPKK